MRDGTAETEFKTFADGHFRAIWEQVFADQKRISALEVRTWVLLGIAVLEALALVGLLMRVLA